MPHITIDWLRATLRRALRGAEDGRWITEEDAHAVHRLVRDSDIEQTITVEVGGGECRGDRVERERHAAAEHAFRLAAQAWGGGSGEEEARTKRGACEAARIEECDAHAGPPHPGGRRLADR